MLLEQVGSRPAQISEMFHGHCFRGCLSIAWKEETLGGGLL